MSSSSFSNRPLRNPEHIPNRTAQEWKQIAADRKRAAMLAESMRRQAHIAEIEAQPIQVSEWDNFSSEEMQAMSAAEQREEAQRQAWEASAQSLGQFILSHPEIPVTSDVSNGLVQFCTAKNIPINFPNLEAGWQALQRNGVRPNYSKQNALAAEAEVEKLRAAGIRIDAPPNPQTATLEELKEWSNRQPSRHPNDFPYNSGATGFDDF